MFGPQYLFQGQIDATGAETSNSTSAKATGVNNETKEKMKLGKESGAKPCQLTLMERLLRCQATTRLTHDETESPTLLMVFGCMVKHVTERYLATSQDVQDYT